MEDGCLMLCFPVHTQLSYASLVHLHKEDSTDNELDYPKSIISEDNFSHTWLQANLFKVILPIKFSKIKLDCMNIPAEVNQDIDPHCNSEKVEQMLRNLHFQLSLQVFLTISQFEIHLLQYSAFLCKQTSTDPQMSQSHDHSKSCTNEKMVIIGHSSLTG